VDKNPAYPGVVEALKAEGTLPRRVLLRQCKYLNNVIEQDHRTIKKRTWLAKGYGSFQSAWRTLEGIETMSMIRRAASDGWQRATLLRKRGSSLSSSLSQPNFSLTFTTECASAPWAANFAMKPVLFAPCQPALTRLKIHLLSLDFHQTRRRSLEKDRFCRFPENPFLVFRSQERQLAVNELERLCIGVGLLRLEGRVGPPH
jgi:DDE domain